MYRSHWIRSLVAIFVLAVATNLFAHDFSAERRRQQAMAFHHRAQERTGLLVPMYIYPADIHTNFAYNRLIDLKRRYETVPIWVILNPASGPGEKVDANYTKPAWAMHGGCGTNSWPPLSIPLKLVFFQSGVASSWGRNSLFAHSQ